MTKKSSKKANQEDGKFLGNFACICGKSTDALSVYEKIDPDTGEIYQDGFCRSGFCDRDNKYIGANELKENGGVQEASSNKPAKPKADLSFLDSLECRGWRERKITKTVSEKYGVKSDLDADDNVVARYYPVTRDGNLVGCKKRILPKEFIGIGDTKSDTELFGQSVFEAGQKYLLITTGECFTKDCELMTDKGWASVDQVVRDKMNVVAVSNDLSARVEKPIAYIQKHYEGDLIELETSRFYSLTTRDHKMLVTDAQGHTKTCTAGKIYRSSKIAVGACLETGGVDLTNDQLSLIVAIAADFKIDYRQNGNIYCHGEFKKERKIERVGNLLERLGIEFRSYDKRETLERVTFNFNAPDYLVSSLQQWGKCLPKNWDFALNQDQRIHVLRELGHWDGHFVKTKNTSIEFTAKNRCEVDLVQAICNLSGVYCSVRERSNQFGTWFRVCYSMDKTHISLQQCKKSSIPFSGKVYCVQTVSGNLLTRQKGIVSVSGNCDAMAAAQILRAEKGDTVYWTPCVSITCGDGSIVKQLKANFDYVTSFEKVILMFDEDEAAQSYIDEAARLFNPGQCFIASLPLKDASDMLKHGRASELKQAFWKAEPFSRVDVLHLSQMWADFENEDTNTKIPFPASWSTVNEMMGGGGERGEITIIGALTSSGKSTIIDNFVYNLIENTPFKVGAMYLESTKREVVRNLMSLDTSMNLRRVDRSQLDMAALKARFFNYLAAKDQFVYVDHQGSLSNDDIFEKLRYLAKGEGCDVIIIDPIQCAVNSSDNSAIIDFMDTLLKFAKETNTYIVAVSHMRKPQGDDPHDVSEYDLLGSSSQNQIAFNTILASRDKMSSDPIIRNATKLLIPKCRRTGLTGDAGWLRYDDTTTHLYATVNPYADDMDAFDDTCDTAINSFGDAGTPAQFEDF